MHIVVQQTSRTFSSCKPETLYPLDKTPHFPFPGLFHLGEWPQGSPMS